MAFLDVKCRAVIVPRKEYLSDIYKLQRANWSKTSSPWWQERALIKAWLSCDSSVRSGRHKYTKLHHTMYWFAMIFSICVFWLSSNKLWPSSFSRPCCAHSELHSAIWCQFSLIAIFMGPTWGPPGSCRSQVGPMLALWTWLSGLCLEVVKGRLYDQRPTELFSVPYCPRREYIKSRSMAYLRGYVV